MSNYWGYHLILNCAKCVPHSIRSQPNITSFAKNLVKKIEMVPYGDPQVVMFGSGNKKGYTLVQLIETSNITAHFVEETDDLYLDVFSCKEFKKEDVLAVVTAHFNPQDVQTDFLLRQARTTDHIQLQ